MYANMFGENQEILNLKRREKVKEISVFKKLSVIILKKIRACPAIPPYVFDDFLNHFVFNHRTSTK